MLTKNPNERIGIGEVWSIIDSLKERHYSVDLSSPMVLKADTNPNNIIPNP